MKKIVKGSTLIETMIYLALFTFIASTISYLAVHIWEKLLIFDKKRSSLITLSSAHDLLLYDLQSAPSIKNGWKVFLPSELIWHKDDRDIGWVKEKRHLIRIEGIYNTQKKQWEKKVRNRVASRIKKVQFVIHGTDTIHYVDFIIADDYHAIDSSAIILEQSITWTKKLDPQ